MYTQIASSNFHILDHFRKLSEPQRPPAVRNHQKKHRPNLSNQSHLNQKRPKLRTNPRNNRPIPSIKRHHRHRRRMRRRSSRPPSNCTKHSNHWLTPNSVILPTILTTTVNYSRTLSQRCDFLWYFVIFCPVCLNKHVMAACYGCRWRSTDWARAHGTIDHHADRQWYGGTVYLGYCSFYANDVVEKHADASAEHERSSLRPIFVRLLHARSSTFANAQQHEECRQECHRGTVVIHANLCKFSYAHKRWNSWRISSKCASVCRRGRSRCMPNSRLIIVLQEVGRDWVD